MDSIFSLVESEVRSYCRSWPTTFTRAEGSILWNTSGREYLDFFAGAGTLNYGHNPIALRRLLLSYISDGGITHSLDMHTESKAEFLTTLKRRVLDPRSLHYRVQFTGPTGASAVESALKLARKISNRSTVAYFTNSYHGMSLGALSVTGNKRARATAGLAVELLRTFELPYDAELPEVSVAGEFGAVIVETVQGEGGLNTAGAGWLRRLVDWSRAQGAVVIIDDIQMGVGRTGPFFSFETAGIVPDIVCLSKSISGYGLPMALILIKPELDVWLPGQDSGTFRGNNLAFVTATAALHEYWADDRLEVATSEKGLQVANALATMAASTPNSGGRLRGRGLAQGLWFEQPDLARRISAEAFARGLLVETAGPNDEVLKVTPPLTTSEELLDHGLAILSDAMRAAT